MTGVFTTIGNIVLMLVILGILVAIHEAGHLAAAKIFKVYWFEYSIGFGPAIFKKKRKKGETAFALRAFPLGGYVSMYGEPGVVPEGFERLPFLGENPEVEEIHRSPRWGYDELHLGAYPHLHLGLLPPLLFCLSGQLLDFLGREHGDPRLLSDPGILRSGEELHR